MASETPESVVFEAEVTPYRSLSRRGLRRVVALVLGASLSTTTLFWWLGAWPVVGFNGGEIMLAMVLLRMHAQSGRQREVLQLTHARLRIVRTDPQGRRSEQSMPPHWLSVRLQERNGRVPGLYLSTRGRVLEVACALGENEKRDLAEALQTAIYQLRNPVFDNPQLRVTGHGS